MRLFVSSLAIATLIAGAALAQTTPAPSQRAVNGSQPFCSQAAQSSANLSCTFASMAQCEADVKGKGGTCVPNPENTTTGSAPAIKK
jgi:Protein of unknown function (DUF3551)